MQTSTKREAGGGSLRAQARQCAYIVIEAHKQTYEVQIFVSGRAPAFENITRWADAEQFMYHHHRVRANLPNRNVFFIPVVYVEIIAS